MIELRFENVMRLDNLTLDLDTDTYKLVQDALKEITPSELVSFALEYALRPGHLDGLVIKHLEEIKKRSNAARAVKQAKKQQHRYVGGNPPFGFIHISRNHLEIEPSQAQTVRRALQLQDEGHALKEITELLNAEGHVTRQGKSFYPATVRRILLNREFYSANGIE
ncbi:recombinase family protein [Alicyclobacillus sp. SO9]|uniref:recombinase family protein n=1 Tax=Alicyclobacillus sp. SO9 TaxID=2665646 RepID=UPI0018E8AB82|nr:recombinase family protein [Alicyclobacillus sp. SO9]QQE77558.1 recombinase family protein [Alicyclobacillus sp. SO9]